ncbi:MAG: DivIVA domain [Acidimicrobiales bacterium]|jgi:DivIVA domain-containing protein|nr:DivIVA domain [Acidimicrobiales bacterium]
MADGRIVITSEPSLSPGEVASRTFASSFRGFDQGEVRHYLERVANELTAAVEREKELKAQMDALRHKAAHPELDEEALTNALGEEAASILRSAREAGADIRAKAEQSVARLVREAEEDAARIRGEAEGVLARRIEEADAAAAHIRQSAEHDAHELRAHAHAEAEAEIEAARARGKEMVVEAQAVRERVLTDLARRRRIAHLQVEQLRAGRERLLEAYGVVRRTLDEATDELTVAEAEARIAAEAAARKAAAEAEVTAADIDAELEAARGTDGPVMDLPVTGTPPQEPPAAEAPAVEASKAEAPEAAPAAPVDETPLDETPAAAEEAEVELPRDERRSSSLRILRPRRHDKTAEAPASVVAVEGSRVDEGVRLLRPAPEAEVEAEVEADVEPDAVEPVNIPIEAGAVSDLFARIKADRAEAVAKAQEVLADSPPPSTPEPPAPPVELTPAPDQPAVADSERGDSERDDSVHDDSVPDDAVEPRIADADESALQRRDEHLAPLESTLTRKLKRVLQDEQNEVLEGLRTVRGKPSADTILPAVAEHAARYGQAVAPSLADALGGGSGRAVVTDDADVMELSNDLAAELVSELRTRLESALHDVEGGGEDGEGPPEDADVVDRVGAAYRQWKSQRVEAVARHHLAWAWSAGAYRALNDGAPTRWVVDDEGGPCPDCDDNALAGATPRGERFPTGQLHPPAHLGCRCLLVPADH